MQHLLPLSFLHPTFLHESGSNNPQGIVSNCGKIPFQPYFSIKKHPSVHTRVPPATNPPILLRGLRKLHPSHLSQPIILNPDDASPSLSWSIPGKLRGVSTATPTLLHTALLPQVKIPPSLVYWLQLLPQHFYSFSRHGFQWVVFLTW